MSMETAEPFMPSSVHLPPRELWIHDSRKDELLPTPLDDRGLVDMIGLIALMKTTVAPGYDWQSSFTDEHHLQWPDRWYPRDAASVESPHVFRNLAISKVVVPRVFHSWVHRITEPPPLPEPDVMQYRIDSQRVAISLFRQVKNSKLTARRRGLNDEGLEKLLVERFDTFATTFERAKQTPKPFQLLEYDNYELKDIHDMVLIGTKLGKFTVTASATDRVKRPVAA